MMYIYFLNSIHLMKQHWISRSKNRLYILLGLLLNFNPKAIYQKVKSFYGYSAINSIHINNITVLVSYIYR